MCARSQYPCWAGGGGLAWVLVPAYKHGIVHISELSLFASKEHTSVSDNQVWVNAGLGQCYMPHVPMLFYLATDKFWCECVCVGMLCVCKQ